MWAAVEALSLGHGGVTRVSRATGLSRTTIHAGVNELEQSESEVFAVEDYGAVRRKGGGRKPVTESDPTVLEDLERLIAVMLSSSRLDRRLSSFNTNSNL